MTRKTTVQWLKFAFCLKYIIIHLIKFKEPGIIVGKCMVDTDLTRHRERHSDTADLTETVTGTEAASAIFPLGWSISFFFMVSAVLSLLPPFYSWYWLASWNSTQASFLLVNSFLFAFQGFYDLIAWVFPQQRKWCLSCFSLVFHFPNFSFMRTIGPAFLFKPRSLATEWMDFSWVRWLLLIQRAGTGEY